MDNSKTLGLPIEYQQLPEYFDAHNTNESTASKNAFIEKLLSEQNVKTVLDMSCGTGSQVFYLDAQGYQVTGSDFSSDLIVMARNKAKAMHRDITFIDGDMRYVKAGKFDAAITIFNAIGHLIKSDFEIALQNIRDNLKENGIYIFDIFNLEVLTNKNMDEFALAATKMVNGIEIHSIQHSEVDQEKGYLISTDQLTIFKNNQPPEKHTNRFSLQIYNPHELNDMLHRNGFDIVAQYDMEGNLFVAEKSISILTVARKK